MIGLYSTMSSCRPWFRHISILDQDRSKSSWKKKSCVSPLIWYSSEFCQSEVIFKNTILKITFLFEIDRNSDYAGLNLQRIQTLGLNLIIGLHWTMYFCRAWFRHVSSLDQNQSLTRVVILDNKKVDIKGTCYWNHLYQVRSKSIDWKTKLFKNPWEQVNHINSAGYK